ncbi:hypothetical protein PHMEG_00039232 [Phytophthora megakarya]|uniref:Uncharacterized protein n=1 Tax=Phytophthora megakarya TaxID=4795 RepID=A0A225UG50_9STRA|nr:hypothetical protein PHMEG_00039232 [Phytophthora megakarya]
MPFQVSHALQYGLLVVAKDVSGAVSCVQCNCRRYKSPYRFNITSITMKNCHLVKWSEYQGLSRQKQVQKKVKARYMFVRTRIRDLQFSFPSIIVDDLIGKVFFNSGDEDVAEAVLKEEMYETSFNEGCDALQKVKSGNYTSFAVDCQLCSITQLLWSPTSLSWKWELGG